MSRNFSNEQISVNLEESAGCAVSAKVVVSSQLLEKFHKDALKKIKKGVVVAGFRKGKAPDEIIASRYPEQLSKELKQLLVNSAYQALSSVGDRMPISPRSVSSTSVKQCSIEDGGLVEFSYEAAPVVPSIDWNKLSLNVSSEVPAITDEEMAEGLKNISYFFAKKSPVTRPSQEGDFISLSLHVSQSGQDSAPVAVFENKYFKLCEEEMTDAFKAKFLGVSSGHRVSETIASPEIQSFLHGDTLTFTVGAVVEIDAPELDDEKARQLQADSLEDLKSKLMIQLETQAKGKHAQQRFKEAEDALAALVDFDLPAGLLEERVSLHTREKLLNARLVEYCSDAELEEKKADLLQAAQDAAKKSLKLLFLSQKIFSDEKLSISREELQHMMDICSRERFGLQPPKDISNEEIQELVLMARERLTYHKAIDCVLAKVQELEAGAVVS